MIAAKNGALGLEVVSGDDHQLYVTWQPDACVSYYKLTLRDQCGTIVAEEAALTTTSHFWTGLVSVFNLTVYLQPVYGDVPGPEAVIPDISRKCCNNERMASMFSSIHR